MMPVIGSDPLMNHAKNPTTFPPPSTGSLNSRTIDMNGRSSTVTPDPQTRENVVQYIFPTAYTQNMIHKILRYLSHASRLAILGTAIVIPITNTSMQII